VDWETLDQRPSVLFLCDLGAREMNQSRTASLIESVFSVVIGYGMALASQLVIFPMFGIHLPLSDNLAIGAWFTIISLVRSYVIRRWFNARLHRAAQKIAGL
jgi:hypothetical protein